MVEVLALTSGRNTPSSRFRVRQFIPLLGELGVSVNECIPFIDKYADFPGRLAEWSVKSKFPPLYWSWAAGRLLTRLPGVIKSYSADVVWLEREFQPGFPTFEYVVSKPIVFDVDDAIWLKKPLGATLAKTIAARSDCVLAGNHYLADWFSDYCQKVEYIPTAVDTKRFGIKEIYRDSGDRFTIGWSGSTPGFTYLYEIEDALTYFINKYPNANLKIIADKSPEFKKIPRDRIEFVSWRPEIEAAELHTFDVGIMPLSNDELSRGKCGFKLLQYMSSGVPVISSDLGANRDILGCCADAGILVRDNDDWISALELIYMADNTARKQMGYAGRAHIEKMYSIEKIGFRLGEVFARY